MKLDPRIEKDTLIYTPFSMDGTNEMIALHDKGYFSDDIRDFSDLGSCVYGELVELASLSDIPYACKVKSSDMTFYSFYIPECNLKPAEKKFRPYTLMEFNDKFTIGRPIKYRSKGEEGREHYFMLLGFRLTPGKDQTIPYISIGPFSYTLDELFEEYEWQEHYTEDFKPFGVEDTE